MTDCTTTEPIPFSYFCYEAQHKIELAPFENWVLKNVPPEITELVFWEINDADLAFYEVDGEEFMWTVFHKDARTS